MTSKRRSLKIMMEIDNMKQKMKRLAIAPFVLLFVLLVASCAQTVSPDASPATSPSENPDQNPSAGVAPSPSLSPEIILSSHIVIEQGDAMMMTVGDEIALTALLKDNVTDKSVNWTSSDESIVIVNDGGKATAIGEGKTYVTVTAADSGVTDMIEITVKSDSLLAVTAAGGTDCIAFKADGTYNVDIMFMGIVPVAYEDIYTVASGILELPNPGPDVTTDYGSFPMWPVTSFEGDMLVVTINTNNGEDLELAKFILTADDAAKLGVITGEADPNMLVRLIADGSTDSIVFGKDGTYSVDINFMGAVPVIYEDTYAVTDGVLDIPNPGPTVSTVFGDFPMWPVAFVEGDVIVITINTNNGEDLELARFVLKADDAGLMGVTLG